MQVIKLDFDGEGVFIKCGSASIIVETNPNAKDDENFAPIWVTIPKGQMIAALDNRDTNEDYGFSSQRGITADLEGPIGFIVFNKKE